MTHPFNTLLPQHLQQQLMDAAAIKRIDRINAAVESVQQQAPHRFHSEKSLNNRVFFNEPTGLYSGSFVLANPRRI